MENSSKHLHEHTHEHAHAHNCEEAKKLAMDSMPSDETLYSLAETFKVFGDYTRIKILLSLFETEMCVNDIAELIGATQSAVSHQLRILKNTGLVKFRREGKQIVYSLADDHVRTIINQGLEHVLE